MFNAVSAYSCLKGLAKLLLTFIVFAFCNVNVFLEELWGALFPLNACQHTEHIPLYCHSMRSPWHRHRTLKLIILYILYLVHHLNKILLPFCNVVGLNVFQLHFQKETTSMCCAPEHFWLTRVLLRAWISHFVPFSCMSTAAILFQLLWNECT